MILYCTCKHEYQDAVYGQGKRVHNECSKKEVMKKGAQTTGYRCTVCGTKRVK